MNTKVEITVSLDETKLEEVKEHIGLKSYETTLEVLLNAKYSKVQEYKERARLSAEKHKRNAIKGICPWCLESCGCSYWNHGGECDGDKV